MSTRVTEGQQQWDAERPVALNRILFGPPGTGKTFATVEAALEVLTPDFLAANRENRAVLKMRFDELVAEGQVRFVTFHQSFSYEDFVEGLRAITDEDSGQIRYEVADGVFKSLCEAAAVKITQQAEAPIDLGGRRIWKMSLGNTLGSDASIYEECITGGYVLLGYGNAIDFSGCRSREEVYQRFSQAGHTLANPNTDYALTSVTVFVTRMKVGDLLVVSDGNLKFRAIGEITGDYAFKPRKDFVEDYSQSRSVKWLRTYEPSLPYGELMNNQFSQMTLYELRPGVIDMRKLQALLNTQQRDVQNGFFVGQRFGQGYIVQRVSADVVEFEKPRGGRLPLPISLVRQLLQYTQTGQISVEDIRQGRVFEKVAEAELEKYIVNGYQSLFAALVEQLQKPSETAPAKDARVLIIDEINRGNVSRIFGELITLIEDSKRAGAAEALSVVLPYSKERFSVPDNVYLIGTMNTADRSLAGLDIALRRRFTFQEMPSRPELLDGVRVEGVNIGQLLRVMNQRIEVLLDRDHCLGHAYFMEMRDQPAKCNLAQLAFIFRQKILPLLQEYFFEDWERISWVLNDQNAQAGVQPFVRAPAQEKSLAALFGSEVAGKLRDLRWELNEAAFESIASYRNILGAAG